MCAKEGVEASKSTPGEVGSPHVTNLDPAVTGWVGVAGTALLLRRHKL